jgi:hypothetical protein
LVFREVDCDTLHYLVVATFRERERERERVALSKREEQKLNMEMFNLKELNYVEVKNRFELKSQIDSLF